MVRDSDDETGSKVDRDPPVPASRPAGYDEADPYEGADLSTYPDWWRAAIERFREYGMRPYRPPQFEDGELVPPTVADLESELGMRVELRSTAPGPEPDWALWVGGEHVGTVGRRREADGHTVYELDREAFEAMVREAAEDASGEP